jgi:hypothetical protein
MLEYLKCFLLLEQSSWIVSFSQKLNLWSLIFDKFQYAWLCRNLFFEGIYDWTSECSSISSFSYEAFDCENSLMNCIPHCKSIWSKPEDKEIWTSRTFTCRSYYVCWLCRWAILISRSSIVITDKTSCTLRLLFTFITVVLISFVEYMITSRNTRRCSGFDKQ